MLVLTRKVDQGIVIAGNIYIRVLGVERDRVKIGIAAPRDIPVLRQELLERDNADPERNGTANSRSKTTGKSSESSESSEAQAASTSNDS